MASNYFVMRCATIGEYYGASLPRTEKVLINDDLLTQVARHEISSDFDKNCSPAIQSIIQKLFELYRVRNSNTRLITSYTADAKNTDDSVHEMITTLTIVNTPEENEKNLSHYIVMDFYFTVLSSQEPPVKIGIFFYDTLKLIKKEFGTYKKHSIPREKEHQNFYMNLINKIRSGIYNAMSVVYKVKEESFSSEKYEFTPC